ncbi:MAG: hypothetical protein H0V88_07140 [Pyrinomonadaceae bacterium]|nr:hypothetical protein [Pyrinomonadaceae bacterium]
MKRKLQIATFLVFAGFVGATSLPRLFVTNANTGGLLDEQSPSNREAVINQLPEIQDLRHTKIGLGQRLTFGLEVIDEEGDNVRTELIEKPKSARFNQNTLTVDWTPQPGDGRNGKFVVQVTELPRDKSRQPRTVTKEYNLQIVQRPVKLLELPPAPLEVDAFVTIIDPARLQAANRQWSIVNLFQRIAEIEADKQIKPGSDVQPTNGAQLFRDSLRELAVIHKNPTLNPDSDKFDRVWNAENWRLIAVRPRINKKVFELRLVYFNIKAAEQAYLMPRMRIVRGVDAKRPEELRQKNNYTFARLFHEAFFDGESMKSFVKNDKARYGEALADFMTRVLTYNDPTEPMMRANFAAMPHNSRLGGGNAYDENGNYLFGDGWALGAIKVAPVMRDGKKVLAFTSPFIDGFAANVEPNKEGTAFKPAPPPVTDVNNPNHIKGWERLIDADDHGNIAIPDVLSDGTVRGSNTDTTLNRFEINNGYRFAETGLRDARRRLFEERGMTCMQCHVRNFDEGNYLVDVSNPQKPQTTHVRPVPRVFFIITPTLHSGRNEYIRREEAEQVGNLQGVFRDYLGIKVKMNSPLARDWVHDTRKGRS